LDSVTYGLAAYIIFTIVGIRYLIKKYRNLRPHVDGLELEELKEWLNDGAILWDVRSEREWETGLLSEAIAVGYGPLPSRVDPKQKIVCYCTSGIRSRAMAENLKKAGAESVAYFIGGYHHLKEDSSFNVIIPS
jgi:phage shock protein E